MKAKIISFFSIKGGVGKTTSCANIAAALGKMKIKVLVIDMDPIASLSNNLINESTKFSCDIISHTKDIIKSVVKKVLNNVDLIPTSLDLSFKFIETDISEFENNYKNNLNKLADLYDVILIDMSSNWNSLNQMILKYSDSILLPVICTPFAIDAISKSLIIIRKTQIEWNKSLKIEGVFVNIFDKRKTDSILLLSELGKIFGSDLYDTIIPNDSTITKLQNSNKVVVNSSSWSPSSIKFCELAKEIYKKLKER